jgi:hypothetical protein
MNRKPGHSQRLFRSIEGRYYQGITQPPASLTKSSSALRNTLGFHAPTRPPEKFEEPLLWQTLPAFTSAAQ